MTHPLLLFVYSLLFKAPEFLESFCIYVFHILLYFIREITEEVDAGFVFQRLDVYDIFAELIALFKCLVLVKEPVAEGTVGILVFALIKLLFQNSYKEILWYWDIAWLLCFVITAKPKAHAFKNEICFPLTKTKCELKKHPNSKFECFFNDFNRTKTSLFLPFPSKLIQDNLVCVLELQE